MTKKDYLKELENDAVTFVRLLALEESGVRDGDGHWLYSDPLSGTLENMRETLAKYQGTPQE